MADIQSAESPGKRNITKSKKLSTRVDLTPMVDLGFLLITFFIFTTTLNQQKVMKLNLPQEGDSTQAAAGKTISLLLCKNNVVKYYAGDNPASMLITNYSPAGIRSIIQQQQQKVAKQFGDVTQTEVLIKPTAECTYENVINTLDEMTITNVKRYILMDANEEEINLSKQ